MGGLAPNSGIWQGGGGRQYTLFGSWKTKKAADTTTGAAGDVLMEESNASVDSEFSSSSSSADGAFSQ